MANTGISDRTFLLLSLALAALVATGFCVIAFMSGTNGRAAPPQTDTLLYQQYARAIAEGHAYSFIPGDTPSTGSTSHLYPWVLSLLYRFGAHGDSLTTAGLGFGVFCYLLMVVLVWFAARKISPGAARLALILCVLSGQTIFTIVGQSDMGLFIVLSMAALTAALYRRYVWLAAALFLCSWCRPEGILLAGLMLFVALLTRKGDSERPALIIAGLTGLFAFVGVLLLNKFLTGVFQFQSLAGKGYFKTYPLVPALWFTVQDLAGILKAVVLGLGKGDRLFYTVPILGAYLGVRGILSREWKSAETRRVEAWWLLSSLAALGLVAISDWQGFLHDRYLGWILPPWLIYVAVGFTHTGERQKTVWIKTVLLLILVSYQVCGLVYFGRAYSRTCKTTMSEVAFARQVDEMLPPGAKIGVISHTGLAYCMPSREVLNFGGIVTPIFANQRHIFCGVEWLKYHPKDRFDAWLLPFAHAGDSWLRSLCGKKPAGQSKQDSLHGLILLEARWNTLDGIRGPFLPSIKHAVQDMQLVDKLDVGFEEDEARCGYTRYSRVSRVKIHPFIATCRAGKRVFTDIGEIILGSETFHVQVEPQRPLRIVLRTAQEATATFFGKSRSMHIRKYTFVSPLPVRVFVNGELAVETQLDIAAGMFTEVMLDIPAKYISDSEVEITIGGDHVSFAYWFYQ